MNVIQQQLDISKSLLAALNGLVDSYEKFNNNTQDQSQSITKIVQSMAAHSKRYETAKNSMQDMSGSLLNISSSKEVSKRVSKESGQLTSDIKKSAEKSTSTTKNTSVLLKTSSKGLLKAQDSILKTADLLQGIESVPESLEKTSNDILKIKKTVKKQSKIVKFLGSIVSLLVKAKDALMTGGASLLLDGVKLMWGFVKGAFKVITSIIGGMTKMFAFTMTLPFTIAQAAVNIGNVIRTELVETIQAAGEEAKQSFDLTSNIGKNADKMTQVAKGLRKTFESPRARLSQLFGMGAQGAATFLNETFKAVDSMGHYAEIFGPSILGSTKNGQFVIEMQRAMAIGAKEMAYYAIEAYNSGVHPIDVLSKTSEVIKKVADENDLDFKALSKEYHKLRTNITEFGHLSANEIGNLVGKLRKMKVKTEDAVNVFKKFTSFEEAAKSSAMLFQTFEMNVDAFDLLTARDPGQMLQQFRDAMFQTGKSFKDLNRHEKALMASITGISEHGLSTLMNYMDLGLTQDEARKRMEAQDPTKEQTKMIKSLTSVIKLIQKTMTFSSPFDAFFTGLSENSMNQSKLHEGLISLSKIYDDIYHMGLHLDLKKVDSLLKPLVKMLKKVDELINGDKFKKVLKITTKTASDFLKHVSYDLETDPAVLVNKQIKKLSVEERIDELYKGLTSMTKEGAPLLSNFVIVGGEIMGSIIKGAVLGVTAAFHLLAGGVDKTVTGLGLTMTDKMRADAKRQGVAIKDYTILNWLGISKTDAEGISDSLGKELGRFVKGLPSMISMVGSLLADLTGIFVGFAGSFLGIIGDMTAQFYDDSNPWLKKYMEYKGFNIEAARKNQTKSTAGKTLDRKSGVLDTISKTHESDWWSDASLKEGYVGTYLSYIEDLQRSFPKTSYAGKFLNSAKTKNLIKYISNTNNFQVIGGSLDDAEEPQRSKAILDIAKSAFELNAILPEKITTMYANKKQKPKMYINREKFVKKQLQAKLSNLVPKDKIAPLFGGRYSDDVDEIFNFANQVSNAHGKQSDTLRAFNFYNKKYKKYTAKPNKASKVKDIEYTGSGMVLYTPRETFYLDDHDSILAAKKGGFLNELFVSVTKHYNNIEKRNFDTFNSKLEESNENISIAKSTMSKLSNNIIKRDELNYDASEEDVLKLFEIYDDIINTISNKEIYTKPAKLSFNV